MIYIQRQPALLKLIFIARGGEFKLHFALLYITSAASVWKFY